MFNHTKVQNLEREIATQAATIAQLAEERDNAISQLRSERSRGAKRDSEATRLESENQKLFEALNETEMALKTLRELYASIDETEFYLKVENYWFHILGIQLVEENPQGFVSKINGVDWTHPTPKLRAHDLIKAVAAKRMNRMK